MITIAEIDKMSSAEREFFFYLKALAPPALISQLAYNYRFHSKRKWRFDFALPDVRIAIEIEGVFYDGRTSRHTTAIGYSQDCEKYNNAVLAKWWILRYTNYQIRSDINSCVDQIVELWKREKDNGTA